MKTQLRAVCIVLTAAFAVNSVHAAEPVVLFDGTSLDHWDVLKCEVEIQDKALLLVSGNGLVQSKEQYADFVLEYEWKALRTEKYDSGIYFRYGDVPAGRPWPPRYQVNLRHDMMGDLGGFPDGKNGVPTKQSDWNKFELTVRGTTVALKVNGTPSWKVDGLEELKGYIAIQAEVPGGGQFLFVDGSTRFIQETIDMDTYRALSTICGHEAIGSNDP